MTDKPWYFSRSQAELYDRCPRARFHSSIRDGNGYERVGASFDQELGRIVHKATERVLLQQAPLASAAEWASNGVSSLVERGCAPAKVKDEFYDQFTKEAAALAAGLTWAWGICVLPDLQRDFTPIQVEKKMSYTGDGCCLPTVADVIFKDNQTSSLVYFDWKTAAWVNQDWMDSWNRSAQLHTTARAVEQTLGEEVEYCVVQALVKGRFQKGYQQSPLVWGYAKGDAGPGDKDFQYNYTSRKGYRRVPVWQVCSTEKWVKGMKREELMKFVPRTLPIIVDPELADTWWRQRVIKERRIASASEKLQLPPDVQLTTASRLQVMDEVFPQHFDQCNPVVGFRCDFYELCHDPYGIGANPEESGIFRKRLPYAERSRT